jgi:hypothetical protein
MKILGNFVSGIGILFAIYAVVGKILNPAVEKALSLGFIQVTAISGMVLATAIMVAGLVIRSWQE